MGSDNIPVDQDQMKRDWHDDGEEVAAPVAETHGDLILFALDEQRYGLELRQVQRVVRVVAITPVPGAPTTMLGLFNLEGKIIPVMNTRRMLYLPERELRLSDQLLIVHTSGRLVALLVDAVLGVHERHEWDEVPLDTVLPGNGLIRGVLRDQGELIFIQDIEAFLSAAEAEIPDKVYDHLLETMPE